MRSESATKSAQYETLSVGLFFFKRKIYKLLLLAVFFVCLCRDTTNPHLLHNCVFLCVTVIAIVT